MHILDLRQTSSYAKYMESVGWMVDGNSGDYKYVKKFPVIGYFIKIQRPEKIELPEIQNLIRKYKPFEVIVEPKNNIHTTLLYEQGFRQSNSYFLPSKTIQVDLTKSESQLLKEMHYKTRYNINRFSNSGLQYSISKEIRKFADFWQECALKQRGMFISQVNEIVALYKAFGKNAYIVSVEKDNRWMSAILMIKAGVIAYYMYAASTVEGKQLFAPTINVWIAMKLAKKNGSKMFDFEGIYDERFPVKSWLGFSRFKKSFNGREIEYPGAFIKYKFPILKFFSV